ncbi:MAG: hypothetical protein IJ705_00575 [Oscillospiraceae bacterium]|nr:hypothetical protein [Oscillospiraceae bacterium]
MKIEHIAMYVENLEKAKDFFVTYLNAKANGGYHNRKTDRIHPRCVQPRLPEGR